MYVEDVIALIKALTIGEKIFENWNCGSVTEVSSIFWHLHKRAPHLADDFSRWVVANRKWDYMPFGTSAGGAATVDEFNDYWKMVAGQKRYESERQLKAKKRKGFENPIKPPKIYLTP